MSEYSATIGAILSRARKAESRYGQFASTHEALGVALEEWEELKDAIRANDMQSIEREAIDLAAVLVRLADGAATSESMRERSTK